MSILIPRNGAFHIDENNLPRLPGFIKANFSTITRLRHKRVGLARAEPLQVAKPGNAFHDAENGGRLVTSLDLQSSTSDSEWRQRVDLAACYRLLAHFRMTDLIYTHATAHVPGEPGHFLINPYGLRWEEITASSLVKIDVEGNTLEPTPYRVNPAGFTIHSAVHMARKDAACVIHTHTRAGMAVAAQAEGLLPLSQLALQYYGRIGTHEYEGIALDHDERERIVRDLGRNCGLILRNHGLLTVGGTVAEAFSHMYYINLACEVQISACSTGGRLAIPPQEVCEKVGRQYDQMTFEDGDLLLEWDAHLRLLDRLDPSFRT